MCLLSWSWRSGWPFRPASKQPTRMIPALYPVVVAATRADRRVQPEQRQRLRGRPDELRPLGDPGDGAPVRAAGSVLRPQFGVRAGLPAHHPDLWAAEQPGYFQDTPWVNHEDAVFAKYYFNAYDNWLAGNRSQVPQAWLIALDSAAARRTTGSGDLLLGMSAHQPGSAVPLAAIGMVTPEGESRKHDHDKVDEFLNLVTEPLLAELAERIDPDTVTIETPFGVGYTGLFQLIAAWRERGWRNAELLVSAPTPGYEPWWRSRSSSLLPTRRPRSWPLTATYPTDNDRAAGRVVREPQRQPAANAIRVRHAQRLLIRPPAAIAALSSPVTRPGRSVTSALVAAPSVRPYGME